jgi:hypothetical protein
MVIVYRGIVVPCGELLGRVALGSSHRNSVWNAVLGCWWPCLGCLLLSSLFTGWDHEESRVSTRRILRRLPLRRSACTVAEAAGLLLRRRGRITGVV